MLVSGAVVVADVSVVAVSVAAVTVTVPVVAALLAAVVADKTHIYKHQIAIAIPGKLLKTQMRRILPFLFQCKMGKQTLPILQFVTFVIKNDEIIECMNE